MEFQMKCTSCGKVIGCPISNCGEVFNTHLETCVLHQMLRVVEEHAEAGNILHYGILSAKLNSVLQRNQT